MDSGDVVESLSMLLAIGVLEEGCSGREWWFVFHTGNHKSHGNHENHKQLLTF